MNDSQANEIVDSLVSYYIGMGKAADGRVREMWFDALRRIPYDVADAAVKKLMYKVSPDSTYGKLPDINSLKGYLPDAKATFCPCCQSGFVGPYLVMIDGEQYNYMFACDCSKGRAKKAPHYSAVGASKCSKDNSFCQGLFKRDYYELRCQPKQRYDREACLKYSASINKGFEKAKKDVELLDREQEWKSPEERREYQREIAVKARETVNQGLGEI